jgi:hypothetical protein
MISACHSEGQVKIQNKIAGLPHIERDNNNSNPADKPTEKLDPCPFAELATRRSSFLVKSRLKSISNDKTRNSPIHKGYDPHLKKRQRSAWPTLSRHSARPGILSLVLGYLH